MSLDVVGTTDQSGVQRYMEGNRGGMEGMQGHGRGMDGCGEGHRVVQDGM